MKSDEYLNKYCENFNLKIRDRTITDSSMRIVGKLDEDSKYVFFNKSGIMKKSDLFIALIENIGVHWHYLLYIKDITTRCIDMASVKSRKGESFESLLRRFRRAVEQDGIMRELKKRKYYMPPSEKRKEKQKLAEKRRRKEKSRK